MPHWFINYSFYILCVYGVVITYFLYTQEWLRESWVFYVVHAFIVGGLITCARQAVTLEEDMPTVLLKVTLLATCNMYVFVSFAHFIVGRTADALMSDSNVARGKTYDRADAAERQMDWQSAAALYQEALAADPKDGEAMWRLAEVYLKMGNFQAAINYFMNMLALPQDADKACAIRMRLADLYENNLRNRRAAAEQLRAIVRDHPQSKYARFARERLDTWQS